MTAVSQVLIGTLAESLRAAEESGVPRAPVRHELPEKDIATAYAVQQAVTDHGIANGRRLVGRKIGLTAKAVQIQLGVDQPDFGTLFADMIFGPGSSVARTRLMQPKIESEIAFMLGRDLDRPDLTVVDVMRATEYVQPAFEIVCSRIRDWDIDIVDTIADNASAGLMVLGGNPSRIESVDLANCIMETHADGALVSSGDGRACLGHPLNAVVWLARRMQELGTPLCEGDLVMSGALGPMADIAGASHVTASFSGLGLVEVSFEDEE
ncbi:MAG: fumarylacetoacetate hydrolase family protein [Alphaproteobacteria bacterium]